MEYTTVLSLPIERARFKPPQWPFFSVRLRPKQVDLFSHWLWVMAPGVGPPVDHRSHEQTTNECEDIPIRVTPRGLGAMTSHMGHHKTIFHMFECRTLQFRTVSFYLWAPFSVPRPWGQQGTPPQREAGKKTNTTSGASDRSSPFQSFQQLRLEMIHRRCLLQTPFFTTCERIA